MVCRLRWGIVGALVLSLAVAQGTMAQNVANKVLEMSPAQLVELLEDEEASVFERAKAAQKLAVVGDAASVPALSALLDDQQLNAYVRSALEMIPDEAAGKALRDATSKLEGRNLVGVVQSLGARGDNESTELLGKLLKHDDPQVRAAAATSLGMLGNVTSAKLLTEALQDESNQISSLADACMECADRLVASDQEQAIAMYDAITAAKLKSVPLHVKQAAFLSRFRLTPQEAISWFGDKMLAEDEEEFRVALIAAREIPGAQVTGLLKGLLFRVKADRQPLLLLAMGARAEDVPMDMLQKAVASENAELQQAAIDVMADQADEKSLEALVDIAFGDSPAAATALTKLQTVKSENADKVIVAKAQESDVPATVAMAELIAARRLEPLKGALAGWMKHENGELRSAAVFGMGLVGDATDLDAMIDQALKGSDDVKGTARGALRVMALRLPDREAAAARLAAEFSGAGADEQAYLLSLLREMGGKTALEVATKAAKSDDARLKELGTKELGAWPNAEAAPVLLDLAKNDKETKYQVRALRGYIRIGRQFQFSNEERMEYFAKAMKVAQRADEKQVAFKILEKVPTAKSLQLCVASMDDESTKRAAAEAAVRIGAKVIESDPKLVVEAMDKALDSGLEGDLVTTARQTRRKARETAGR